MKYEDMKPNIQYIITKGSDDGTFQVGEIISRGSDVLIYNHTMKSWLACDYADGDFCIPGMDCKPDMQWLESHIANLEKQVEYFKKIYEEYEELIEL